MIATHLIFFFFTGVETGTPPPVVVETQRVTGAGRGKRLQLRRRVIIGEEQYLVTREELWALLQDMAADEIVPEIPVAAVTKKAPLRVNKPAGPGLLADMPQRLQAVYRRTEGTRDDWVARMVAEAVRARLEAIEAIEQDDEEVILLLH